MSINNVYIQSAGAGRERPGIGKASMLIEILWKTNGFERRGGQEQPGMEKASILIKIL